MYSDMFTFITSSLKGRHKTAGLCELLMDRFKGYNFTCMCLPCYYVDTVLFEDVQSSIVETLVFESVSDGDVDLEDRWDL